MQYILYKNPIQLDTLAVVQYLVMEHGLRVEPLCCVERNHPPWVTALPAIEEGGGQQHVGLYACVQYYERISGISDLLIKATAWKTLHSTVRIHS